jgi:hypothetical protein
MRRRATGIGRLLSFRKSVRARSHRAQWSAFRAAGPACDRCHNPAPAGPAGNRIFCEYRSVIGARVPLDENIRFPRTLRPMAMAMGSCANLPMLAHRGAHQSPAVLLLMIGASSWTKN